MSINAILNINKPSGKTSRSIVNLVRRYSRQKRVGHAGTLDPLAAGVLPVCLGQATRVSPYILSQHKTYLAVIELGVATDTYDADGRITQRTDPSNITREQVEKLMPQFEGTILQKPPIYSALKQQGKRLYHLARAGIEVVTHERQVEVFHLELLQWQPPYLTIEVECGKGTYIRSLAHDIGQRLGCGAHIKGLVRTACGPFNIKDSVTLEQLEEAYQNTSWQDLLYPLDTVFEQYQASIVDQEKERAVRNGRMVAMDGVSKEEPCRVYSAQGRFIALLRYRPERGAWQPEMVFNDTT